MSYEEKLAYEITDVLVTYSTPDEMRLLAQTARAHADRMEALAVAVEAGELAKAEVLRGQLRTLAVDQVKFGEKIGVEIQRRHEAKHGA